jgi:hypothetical protein
MDTNTQAIMVSKLVQEQNYTGAENLLAELGKTALRETIEALPTKDLLAVVRNHDSSKPTVIHGIINPEQFVKILSLEHLINNDHRSEVATHAAGMISAIVLREDESDGFTSANFLEAALQSEGSTNEVIKYLMPQGGIADSDDYLAHKSRLEEMQEYIAKSSQNGLEEWPESEWEKILNIAIRDAPEHVLKSLEDALSVHESVIDRMYTKIKNQEHHEDESEARVATEEYMSSAPKADGQDMSPTEESAL